MVEILPHGSYMQFCSLKMRGFPLSVTSLHKQELQESAKTSTCAFCFATSNRKQLRSNLLFLARFKAMLIVWT
eukprot:c41225_g1_i1 orf=45-263(+)